MQKTILFAALMIFGWNCNTGGQTIQDPSFETFDVADGSSVMAPDGPWIWANDAGIVDPFLPNSSNGVRDNTASGTFDPVDGDQYATTYAGADRVAQLVDIVSAGEYQLSVWAAAPAGTLTIPGVFANQPLTSGAFQFEFAGDPIGDVNTLDPGTPWSSYTARISVPSPGNYMVGIRNIELARYFINYDGLSLQSVPEFSTAGISCVLLSLFLLRKKNRRWRNR